MTLQLHVSAEPAKPDRHESRAAGSNGLLHGKDVVNIHVFVLDDLGNSDSEGMPMPSGINFGCNADDAVTIGDVKRCLQQCLGIRENTYVLTDIRGAHSDQTLVWDCLLPVQIASRSRWPDLYLPLGAELAACPEPEMPRDCDVTEFGPPSCPAIQAAAWNHTESAAECGHKCTDPVAS